ncbi:hypothetical protein GCM10017056_42680 [Seohaeicola zhoushanensis]|uniref:Uncharacterized protein n=1 Tax=Seohaeicola zhoushanensis TaxID=1569283 RepID=A0A8J3MAF1_9RHOB|nr:hypothetical protein GCM10017056_42680 [Seohaeicola zhoushanensis]
MCFLPGRMLRFAPSRKPPVKVLRQSSYPLNHPTMPRKDPAQFPEHPVVSSHDDGGTQQGTGHADTYRGECHQPFALVPGGERPQMPDPQHGHYMQDHIRPVQPLEVVRGGSCFQRFRAASSPRKKSV